VYPPAPAALSDFSGPLALPLQAGATLLVPHRRRHGRGDPVRLRPVTGITPGLFADWRETLEKSIAAPSQSVLELTYTRMSRRRLDQDGSLGRHWGCSKTRRQHGASRYPRVKSTMLAKQQAGVGAPLPVTPTLHAYLISSFSGGAGRAVAGASTSKPPSRAVGFSIPAAKHPSSAPPLCHCLHPLSLHVILDSPQAWCPRGFPARSPSAPEELKPLCGTCLQPFGSPSCVESKTRIHLWGSASRKLDLPPLR
jgi:hypothetical protein